MKMSDVENRLENIGLVSWLGDTFNQPSSLSTAHSWVQARRNYASLFVIFIWNISALDVLLYVFI